MDGLELGPLENINSLLLVSCGGILGSNIRFLIFQSLDKIFINKYLKIVLINNLALFLLGFFSAILSHNSALNYSKELVLLISIGFLGGLSTFSSFMYDLFELSFNFQFIKVIKILIFSIIIGLISLSLGFLLGNQ